MTKDRQPIYSREFKSISATGACSSRQRDVPAEVGVALVYNGVSYAVMMMSPMSVEEFVLGFSLSEGIISGPEELMDVEIVPVPDGLLARVTIPDEKFAALGHRRRNLAGQSSCGLCGVEDLQAAIRPLAGVGAPPQISVQSIFKATGTIRSHQPLNRATGGMHGAAFVDTGGDILLLREDVGRHNAMDKLIGAMLGANLAPDDGYLLLTSRCSYELVQKAVSVGFSLMVTVSAPTGLAVELAEEYGLTLVALARDDEFLVAHDPHQLFACH